MRKVEIINDFVLKSLKKKDELTEVMKGVEEVNARIIKENDENQKQFQDTLSKLQREDEKVRPELQREAEKIELGEFETVSRVYLGKEGEEKGKVIIEISDQLEEFKITFKQRQNEQSNSSDTNKGEVDGSTNETVPAPVLESSGD